MGRWKFDIFVSEATLAFCLGMSQDNFARHVLQEPLQVLKRKTRHVNPCVALTRCLFHFWAPSATSDFVPDIRAHHSSTSNCLVWIRIGFSVLFTFLGLPGRSVAGQAPEHELNAHAATCTADDFLAPWVAWRVALQVSSLWCVRVSDNLVLDGASKDRRRDVVVKFDSLLDNRSFHRWSSVLSDDVLDKIYHQVSDAVLEAYLELDLQRKVSSDSSVQCGVSDQH